MSRAWGGLVLTVLAGTACGGESPDARFPSRPEGCDVRVFQEAPTVATENIGPVRARCGDTVSDNECLRTLQDAACRLGADVVWGVNDPEIRDGKKYITGRAAHTTTTAAEGSGALGTPAQ